MDLAGTNTYSGPTVISNGTLLVNGALGAGPVTVYGKLGGCGALSGPVAVQPGGVLAPGASPGILTISNTLTLLPGSTTLLEVSKSPVTNDSVRVTGAVAYGGTLLVTNISTQPLGAGDHFQLFIIGWLHRRLCRHQLPRPSTPG